MNNLELVVSTIKANNLTITEDELKAISKAFSTKGKTKGYLKSKCPPGLPGAAWQALQNNPWKLSIYRCMFFTDDQRELFTKLSEIKIYKHGDFDYDKAVLKKIGAW